MPVTKNIAIIGGGPASSTLAILLSKKGYRVVIFATANHAPILVGESLVPMIVPMLKDLGVEEEVASYSTYKPGACFTFNTTEVFEFRFSDTPSDLPSYAYNVPRDKFNQTLLNAAKKAGATVIDRQVELSKVGDKGEIKLDDDSLNEAISYWDGNEPDLIVDSAGRANLIGQLLDIPMENGPRKDVALFAHVDKTELVDAGYVHNDRMEQGWCWRIPLPERVSLGFVIPENYASEAGEAPEQQYDFLLKNDDILKQLAPDAKRLTAVLRFNNYQSLSEKLCGKNWVMLGDSGGFVDPVFSSGMLLAMDSAYKLVDTLEKGEDLEAYETSIKAHLKAWFEIVSYYYNGRLMTAINVGDNLADNLFNRLLTPWISGHVSRIFSGAAGSKGFSLSLLRFLVKYGLKDKDPRNYEIK